MAKRKTTKPKSKTAAAIVPEQIDQSIIIIRGQKVLLDSQLAGFYGVQTRVLIQGVKRNVQRFPADFMFQLNGEEWDSLRSQFVILKGGRGQHRKYLPYAFTEQGVAMLSSVLRSPRAVEVNILIMRAFVRLRQLLSAHKELADRLAKLEQRMTHRDASVDQQFREIFTLLEKLFTPPTHPRKQIGFHSAAHPKNEPP